LAKGEEIEDSLLFNVFERVAYEKFKGLGKYRDRFIEAGADSVHLAGSGPTLFTMVKDQAKADGICSKLKECNLAVYSVKTLGETDFFKLNMVG